MRTNAVGTQRDPFEKRDPSSIDHWLWQLHRVLNRRSTTHFSIQPQNMTFLFNHNVFQKFSAQPQKSEVQRQSLLRHFLRKHKIFYTTTHNLKDSNQVSCPTTQIDRVQWGFRRTDVRIDLALITQFSWKLSCWSNLGQLIGHQWKSECSFLTMERCSLDDVVTLGVNCLWNFLAHSSLNSILLGIVELDRRRSVGWFSWIVFHNHP